MVPCSTHGFQIPSLCKGGIGRVAPFSKEEGQYIWGLTQNVQGLLEKQGLFPPLEKGGEGGFYNEFFLLEKIPLSPPFSKGEG